LCATVVMSVVTVTPSTPRVPSRARSSVRVAIHVMRIGRPARRVISSSLRRRTSNTPLPTVPNPIRPTCSGFMAIDVSQQPIPAKHLLDPPYRLPRSRLVLDHREAHVAIAELAEADPRRDRHLRLG